MVHTEGVVLLPKLRLPIGICPKGGAEPLLVLSETAQGVNAV